MENTDFFAFINTYSADNSTKFPLHPSDEPLPILYIDRENSKVFMWEGTQYKELAGIETNGVTANDITLDGTNFTKVLQGAVTIQNMADLTDKVNTLKRKEFLDKAYIELNEVNNHLEFYTYDELSSQFVKKFEIGGSAIVDVLKLIKGEKPVNIPINEIALYNREIILPDNTKTIRPELVIPDGSEYGLVVNNQQTGKVVYREINGELKEIANKEYLDAQILEMKEYIDEKIDMLGGCIVVAYEYNNYVYTVTGIDGKWYAEKENEDNGEVLRYPSSGYDCGIRPVTLPEIRVLPYS